MKRTRYHTLPFSLVLIAAGQLPGQEIKLGESSGEVLALSESDQSRMLAQHAANNASPLYATSVSSSDALTTDSGVLEPEEDFKSRIGVGISLFTGAKASIGASESFTARTGPATGGGINRDYIDGFVHLDSSGNLGDVRVPTRTHNFGFVDPAQVNLLPLAGTINFHDVRLAGGGYSSQQGDNFSPGIEIHYSRRLDFSERWRYELELGLGFQDFDFNIKDKPADFEVLEDTYQLGGVDPTVFGVPYTGGFLPKPTGSPKIGDTPTRTMATATGMVQGGSELDSYAILGRIGPTARYDFSEDFDFTFMGGLLLGYLNADVTYNERQILTMGGSTLTFNRMGSFSDSDWVWGYFGAIRASYVLTERLDVYGEVRYSHLESFDLEDGIRSADLDFGSGLGFLIGVTYDF